MSRQADVSRLDAALPALRRSVRLGLERLGWLGPFYRARERQIAQGAD